MKITLNSESASKIQLVKGRYKEVRAKLKATIKAKNDALKEKIKSNNQLLKDKLAESKVKEQKDLDKARSKKAPTNGKIGKARRPKKKIGKAKESVTKKPGRRSSK